MKIHNVLEPFPYMLIDDFLDEYSFENVFKEILLFAPNMVDPKDTGAAKYNGDESYRKKGSGMFLDDVYSDRNMSNILKCFGKLFTPAVLDAAKEHDWFFKYYYHATTHDWTLIQSYGNGDYYQEHHDQCLFTSVTLIVKEPWQYEGGELFFKDYNHSVDLKNNQTIIFPARIPHEVLPISRSSDNIDGNRFTVTKFIHYKTVN